MPRGPRNLRVNFAGRTLTRRFLGPWAFPGDLTFSPVDRRVLSLLIQTAYGRAGGLHSQKARQDPAASWLVPRGGRGVHREVESEGLASNLRAVAEARAIGEPVGQERADPAWQPFGEGNTSGTRSKT